MWVNGSSVQCSLKSASEEPRKFFFWMTLAQGSPSWGGCLTVGLIWVHIASGAGQHSLPKARNLLEAIPRSTIIPTPGTLYYRRLEMKLWIASPVSAVAPVLTSVEERDICSGGTMSKGWTHQTISQGELIGALTGEGIQWVSSIMHQIWLEVPWRDVSCFLLMCIPSRYLTTQHVLVMDQI